MRSLRRFIVLVPAIAVFLIAAEGLYADTFQFSYSGNAFFNALPGVPPVPITISGSGTFTTNPQSGGSFLITGMSGTQNGSAFSFSSGAFGPISLLAPNAFGNDNLLFASAPFLDAFGVSFATNAQSNGTFGAFNNIEFNSTDSLEPFGYVLTSTAIGCGFVPITFSVSSVPEPSTLILVGSGILALAAAWRRHRLNVA